jgi:hypothetical protein
MSTESKYNLNAVRLISLWLAPTIFTAIILVFIGADLARGQMLSWKAGIAWGLFVLFAVGVFVYLFFNHLPLARQTQLIIEGKTIKCSQAGHDWQVKVSDIEEIIEYSANRLPWSYIMKWTIKAGNKQITISSLTISQSNFERHFYNKITHKTSFFPTI